MYTLLKIYTSGFREFVKISLSFVSAWEIWDFVVLLPLRTPFHHCTINIKSCLTYSNSVIGLSTQLCISYVFKRFSKRRTFHPIILQIKELQLPFFNLNSKQWTPSTNCQISSLSVNVFSCHFQDSAPIQWIIKPNYRILDTSVKLFLI